MSIRAMSWAFEQTIPADLKLVLLALADWADGDGVAFPGQKSVATKVSMSERTVRDKLTKLEELGLIERRRRSGEGGYRTTDEYRLLAAPFAGRTPPPTGKSEAPYRQTVAGQEPSEPSVTTKARARQLPVGLRWDTGHVDKALARGVNIEVEFEKFKDYHLAKGSTFVDWGRAFHTWLNNARPEPVRQRPDSRPSRTAEIDTLLTGSLGLDGQKGLGA